jgi:uncharacterized protein (DUF111 family)
VETVATPYGEIRIKVGTRPGGAEIAAPEYDDCALAAGRQGVPLNEVMYEAQRAWRQRAGREST